MFLRFLAKTAEGFTNELATKAGKTYSLISYSIARLLLSSVNIKNPLAVEHMKVVKRALIGDKLTNTIGKEAEFDTKLLGLLEYWKINNGSLFDLFKLDNSLFLHQNN